MGCRPREQERKRKGRESSGVSTCSLGHLACEETSSEGKSEHSYFSLSPRRVNGSFCICTQGRAQAELAW